MTQVIVVRVQEPLVLADGVEGERVPSGLSLRVVHAHQAIACDVQRLIGAARLPPGVLEGIRRQQQQQDCHRQDQPGGDHPTARQSPENQRDQQRTSDVGVTKDRDAADLPCHSAQHERQDGENQRQARDHRERVADGIAPASRRRELLLQRLHHGVDPAARLAQQPRRGVACCKRERRQERIRVVVQLRRPDRHQRHRHHEPRDDGDGQRHDDRLNAATQRSTAPTATSHSMPMCWSSLNTVR